MLKNNRLLELARSSLMLGLTSFGGPVAHLAYFRQEYVVRRKWLADAQYADLVALAQFLPGPASSQVSMAVGWLRAGWLGAIVAWLGFTLPSALLMVLAAWGGTVLPADVQPWLRGLPLVAVAVVAQAVLVMASQFLTNRRTATAAVLMVVFLALAPLGLSPLVVLALLAGAGWFWFRPSGETVAGPPPAEQNLNRVLVPLGLFVLLLFLLPMARVVLPSEGISLAEGFYRTGALVFGGGHVVLPLLQEQLGSLPNLTQADVLAGYGWAQALPGPLFAVSAYFGYLSGGWTGTLVAVVAIFLPALLLILGCLPVWNRFRGHRPLRGTFAAVNAGVVGMLAHALYSPLWVQAVRGPEDFALAILLFGAAVVWKVPAWAIVLLGLLGGFALQAST